MMQAVRFLVSVTYRTKEGFETYLSDYVLDPYKWVGEIVKELNDHEDDLLSLEIKAVP